MTNKRKNRVEINPEFCRRLYAENTAYRERCHLQAKEWAAANKSDSFAYNRALNDYRTGLAYAGTAVASDTAFINAEGYNVDWGKEERSYTLNNKHVFYMVKQPKNMERPTA